VTTASPLQLYPSADHPDLPRRLCDRSHSPYTRRYAGGYLALTQPVSRRRVGAKGAAAAAEEESFRELRQHEEVMTVTAAHADGGAPTLPSRYSHADQQQQQQQQQRSSSGASRYAPY
jgi:hypothetical protein